jgi:hypothetical protein
VFFFSKLEAPSSTTGGLFFHHAGFAPFCGSQEAFSSLAGGKKGKRDVDPGPFLAADLADALTSKLFCDEDAISSTHWGHEESNRGERERASRREKASRGGRWGMADFDEKTHAI